MFDQRQRRLLLLLAIACFTEGYDFNALMVALPHLRHDFGLSRAAADLWVAAVYLGAAPALWLGRRADRHGRRGVLVLAVAGYTVCSAATAVAPDMGIFVITQFFARTFMAVQVAVAWTVAAEELPAERRGFGFGILALASALGTGLGAVLEAAVLAPLGASWRWLYVASGPLAGKQFILYKPLTTIGSSQSSDIYLFKDTSILPQHGVIELRGAQTFIRSNGPVFISGAPARNRALQSGDLIQIGRYAFHFRERQRK